MPVRLSCRGAADESPLLIKPEDFWLEWGHILWIRWSMRTHALNQMVAIGERERVPEPGRS